MWRLMVTVASTLVLANAAGLLAQTAEQTPENAHQFLVKLFDVSGVWYATVDHQFTEFTGRESWRSDNPAEQITIDRSDRCVTQFASPRRTLLWGLPVDARDTAADRYSQYRHTSHAEWLEYYKRRVDTPLDWSTVTEVRPSGSTVTVAGPISMRFYFQTEDMAVRAAYAMQVILDSCDPMAGMGF